MSAEGFLVSNPKHNNITLVISCEGAGGTRKTIKTLAPGESCLVKQKSVRIDEETRPPRLELRDGQLVPDTRRAPMRVSAR